MEYYINMIKNNFWKIVIVFGVMLAMINFIYNVIDWQRELAFYRQDINTKLINGTVLSKDELVIINSSHRTVYFENLVAGHRYKPNAIRLRRGEILNIEIKEIN